ncbi:FecCD family ABC transporter permease [Kistimonas asteriae]|uniref:FecCD family ABC transporter permease n=1 Tax=Kistimonas asteriae TaxID=517724 RepID=UPI001BAE1ED3|nr:iron ABC transporter permease [Kistimonas asteriae]
MTAGYLVLRNAWVSHLLPRRALIHLGLLLLATATLAILAMAAGSMTIHPVRVIQTLLGQGTQTEQLIIQQFRMPRMLMALLVGTGLGIAGAILQGLMRNPLASPDVLGVTDGASVVAVFALTVFAGLFNIIWLPAFVFAGGLVTVLAIYAMAWKGGVAPRRMILIGIGLGALLSAARTVVMIQSPIQNTAQAQVWLNGSLNAANWQQVQILSSWYLLLLPLLVLAMRSLSAQTLGDDLAKSLGSRLNRERFGLIMLSTALATAGVAFCGSIGFVGLMAPHIARRLLGNMPELHLPGSALVGALLVLGSDLAGRIVLAPMEVPVGIFTALIGAPYFIYLLVNKK